MATVDSYIAKITQEHDEKPNFVATVTASVDPFVQVQNALLDIQSAFDVDTAIGDQLDTIGLWVGVSRKVPVPITGTFLTWNGTAETGWNGTYGLWYGSGDSLTQISVLGDSDYRSLIKGKIAANSWDGSIPGAYAILEQAFGLPGAVSITDNQDMSQTVNVIGGMLTSVQTAMISQGMLPIKPAGVTQVMAVGDFAPLEVFIYRTGTLVANDSLYRATIMAKTFVSAAYGWADATLTAAPALTQIITIKRNGSAIGTITFSAGSTDGTPVLNTACVLLLPGDFIEIVGPNLGLTTNLSLSFLLFAAAI
jgi:hypothetical protein